MGLVDFFAGVIVMCGLGSIVFQANLPDGSYMIVLLAFGLLVFRPSDRNPDDSEF